MMADSDISFSPSRPICPNCGRVMVVIEDTLWVGRHEIEYLLFCENCLHTELVVKERED